MVTRAGNLGCLNIWDRQLFHSEKENDGPSVYLGQATFPFTQKNDDLTCLLRLAGNRHKQYII